MLCFCEKNSWFKCNVFKSYFENDLSLVSCEGTTIGLESISSRDMTYLSDQLECGINLDKLCVDKG